ncbi:hypothetical protein ASG03_10025 [Rhizobium sp. Leaf341]|nr:hypothetical protein ASG03_10025 [Rhizobium sp. Leaf341]
MATRYDLEKTQFLVEDLGVTTRLRAFRRKREGALLDKDGGLLRLISWRDFRKLCRDWPEEAQSDGLRYAIVWTLVPVAGIDSAAPS